MIQDCSEIVSSAAALAARFQNEFKMGAPVFPSAELSAVAGADLHAICLPSEMGGADVGISPGRRGILLSVLKEIGRVNQVLGRVFEGHVNALILLREFASSELLHEAARDVVERQFVFGVWNTGPAGSPQLLRLPNGNYRMRGAKTFATGVGRIQRAIVTAELPDGGWQMCLVPLDTAPLKIDRDSWHPLGMQASESFNVEFQDVELPPKALVGQPGDYYREPAFTSGALRFSAVHLGGAQSLFESCCQFLCATHRENDSLQLQRIGQMAVLLESGRQWLHRGSQWLEESFSNPAGLAVQAQMMRIAVEEICTRMIQLVELCVGARGLTGQWPFARVAADLQMYLRQGGYDQAFQSVGKDALRSHA